MRRRCLGGLRRASERAPDGLELGLAVDREQDDLAAAARLAFERPAVERRSVGVGRLEHAKGDQPVVAERAYRQQWEAAAAAGDRTRGVSGIAIMAAG